MSETPNRHLIEVEIIVNHERLTKAQIDNLEDYLRIRTNIFKAALREEIDERFKIITATFSNVR